MLFRTSRKAFLNASHWFFGNFNFRIAKSAIELGCLLSLLEPIEPRQRQCNSEVEGISRVKPVEEFPMSQSTALARHESLPTETGSGSWVSGGQ